MTRPRAPLTHVAPGPALVDPRVYVEPEALVPKAIAGVKAPGAKTEALKQPKKQDETEAPPGWKGSQDEKTNSNSTKTSSRSKMNDYDSAIKAYADWCFICDPPLSSARRRRGAQTRCTAT